MPTPNTPAPVAEKKVFTFDPATQKAVETDEPEDVSLTGETSADTPEQSTGGAEDSQEAAEPEPDTLSPAPTMPLDDPRIDGEGVNAILWVNGEQYPLAGCTGFVHYQDEKTHRRYFRLKDQSGNPKEYVNIGSNRNEGYQLATLLLAAGLERGAFL